MYTGVPHFDRKMLEADMILLSPKSVICTTAGLCQEAEIMSPGRRQVSHLDIGIAIFLAEYILGL